MLTPRASIAVVEIIVYVPCAIALGFVLYRHGLSNQVGYYYLVTFILLRLTGAGLEIGADKKPNNQSLYAWAAILSTIGISALELGGLGLLMRVIDMTSTHVRSDPMSRKNVFFRNLKERTYIIGKIVDAFIASHASATSRRSRVIQMIQFVAVAGLVVCIIGGTNLTSNNQATVNQGYTLFKAGVAIFLAIYAALIILTLISATELQRIPRGERRVLLAVMLSILLLAVRMLLAILGVYTSLRDFKYFTGRALVTALMGTLQEMLIVIMFIAVGLTVPRYRPAYQGGDEGKCAGEGAQREVGSRTTLTRLEPHVEGEGAVEVKA